MTGLVIALPSAVEERLLLPLLDEGYSLVARPAGSEEVAAAITDLRPGAALVGAGAPYLSAAVVDAADRAGTRLVVLVEHDAHRSIVRRLGLLDPVDADAGWETVRAALAAEAPALTVEDALPARRAPVTAVWGPAGAPGRTTTAIALASALAASGRRVALIDADVHAASIAPALGLLDEAPGIAAACRLAGADALTVAELERLAQHYRGGGAGFAVLTGLHSPGRWPELSPTRLRAVLRLATEWVDHVVVDVAASLDRDEEVSSDLLAPRRNAATLTVLEEAHRTVLVGAADPIGVTRLLRGRVELGEVVPLDRVDVVVNRVRRAAAGAAPSAQLRSTLLRFGGFAPAALVPEDPSAHDGALLSGRPVTESAPRSPAAVALRRYAADHLGAAPSRRARRRGRAASARTVPA